MTNLENKNILLLCVKLFNYENIIRNKLIEQKANVHYYDERPNNSVLAKGIIRVRKSFYNRTIKKYYQGILKDSFCQNLDFLFVVKGEVVPVFFLKEIKRINPSCKFIYYTWDSFANNKNALKILSHFDKKYTFDFEDSKKYNLDFQPLFCSDSYLNIKPFQDSSDTFDLTFIGTAHSDRYTLSNNIVQFLNKHDFKTFAYYYLPSKLVYFLKRMMDPHFEKLDFSKLSFKSLAVSEVEDIVKESKALLDIQHPGQTGLTMRTFEALGAKRKIITTNKEIKKYCFYNPDNVLIIDRKCTEIDLMFLQKPFRKIPDNIVHRISIEGWVESIFSNKKSSFDWFQ